VRNVDFASTCFSCRQPLGKLAVVGASARSSEALEPRKPPSRTAPRGGTASATSFLIGAVFRLLFVVAVVWAVGRALDLPIERLLSDSPEEAAEPSNEADPPPPSEPVALDPLAPMPEEQNGFRLVQFAWSPPALDPSGPFRVGETVSGRSEIQGFGVTADGTIDVTVALAFRDPTGKLVEPVSPTTLRQPKESDTLFTSFDYAIPADSPAGEYDLEIAVDDAVSSRSVRFHRTVTVEAASPR
jgi:hypothetical protein